MIIDLQKFSETERPFWVELESVLDRMESGAQAVMTLEQVRRFQYLYERTSADLARIVTFSSEPETRRYLEHLVARAYSEMHETRDTRRWFRAWPWLTRTLPQTFRRQARAFQFSLAVTLAGCLFGGFATAFDPESKEAILPKQFANHLGDPAERVKEEEEGGQRPGMTAGHLTAFSGKLMNNNIRVSIKAMALGMTYGVGTILVLFYNGVVLGLITVDYVTAGQTKFLLAWLMPHGVIEIPAILIGGQCGLMLAGALIGWGRRNTIRQRMRAIARDLVTLIFGVALMLVWAGLVEAFFSQYHEPVLPYPVKIAFGAVELAALILFLGWAGKETAATRNEEGGSRN